MQCTVFIQFLASERGLVEIIQYQLIHMRSFKAILVGLINKGAEYEPVVGLRR